MCFEFNYMLSNDDRYLLAGKVGYILVRRVALICELTWNNKLSLGTLLIKYVRL